VLQLEEHQVSRNGDFGFISIGASREEVSRLLLLHAHDANARQALLPELHEFIINLNEAVLIDIASVSIRQAHQFSVAYRIAESNMNAELSAGNDYLQTIPSQIGRPLVRYASIDQLIAAMALLVPPTDVKLAKLRRLRDSYDEASRNYTAFLTSESVVRDYLMAYTNRALRPPLWLGYHTTKWFAQIKKFNLYIWRKDSQHPGQLELVENHEEPPRIGLGEFHLLHTDGFTHYNLLTLPAGPLMAPLPSPIPAPLPFAPASSFSSTPFTLPTQPIPTINTKKGLAPQTAASLLQPGQNQGSSLPRMFASSLQISLLIPSTFLPQQQPSLNRPVALPPRLTPSQRPLSTPPSFPIYNSSTQNNLSVAPSRPTAAPPSFSSTATTTLPSTTPILPSVPTNNFVPPFLAMPTQPTLTEAEKSHQLGITLAQEGCFAEAIPHYQKAITLSPQNADYYLNVAEAYYRMKNNLAALENYQHVTQINPDKMTDHFWNRKGNILSSLNRFAEAISCYEAALRKNPTNKTTIDNLALTKRDLATQKAALPLPQTAPGSTQAASHTLSTSHTLPLPNARPFSVGQPPNHVSAQDQKRNLPPTFPSPRVLPVLRRGGSTSSSTNPMRSSSSSGPALGNSTTSALTSTTSSSLFATNAGANRPPVAQAPPVILPPQENLPIHLPGQNDVLEEERQGKKTGENTNLTYSVAFS